MKSKTKNKKNSTLISEVVDKINSLVNKKCETEVENHITSMYSAAVILESYIRISEEMAKKISITKLINDTDIKLIDSMSSYLEGEFLTISEIYYEFSDNKEVAALYDILESMLSRLNKMLLVLRSASEKDIRIHYINLKNNCVYVDEYIIKDQDSYFKKK